MKSQWDIRFEQREPPTEDSNPNQHGDRGKSKAIFISENLILFEKEDSLALIREYINAFARNYEDMQRLDPKVTVH